MHAPPQVILHAVDRSDWIERYVMERLRWIDRHAGSVTSCKVILTREQSSHHRGNVYSVMVEARLPPQHDLTAKKQRAIRNMSRELPALINAAFTAIARQVLKLAGRRARKGRVKAARAA